MVEFHPLAELFPLMDGAEFDALVSDISENGLREPIVLHDNQILDGRNRYRACEKAGIEPKFEQWENGSDPRAYVVSKNLHRRHLNESQRAMIAARLAVTSMDVAVKSHGPDGKFISHGGMTNAAAAELLNVGEPTVSRARRVLTKGTKDEISAIESGKATARSVAEQISAKIPKDRRAKKRTEPLSQSGKNPERIQRMQMNAEIWERLSNAIIGLTGLPDPKDVLEIVNGNVNRKRVVKERLSRSLDWLTEFSDAWNAQ